MTRSGSKVVTTEAVLWEWLNALADATTRTLPPRATGESHADTQLEIVPFEAELNGAAVEPYQSRADKDWSLTDWLSFVVMERRRLTGALTTDHHFEQAGLKALML